MANEVAGKVAIVTGGAKGIGAATAEVFVEEGAKVVIADVDVENGEALADRLGATARFLRTDVSEKAQVQALVDYALAEFGDLDIMFNNAGVTGVFHNRFLDDELDDFETVMNTNLASVMHGCRIAARHMVGKRKGSIINNASIAALDPGYALFTYRASKAGIINLTKSLAIDIGEYGVRVNAIAPGHIPTGLNHFATPGMSPRKLAALQAAMEPHWFVNQPLKRQGAPRDVGNTVLFLASDRAAQVTGQVIAVDGGVTAGDPINLNAILTEAHAKFMASWREEP
jgi:NAD(P)-dependent dehydrogenase (short-subunit alcohol dehydrogenase family)